VCTDWTHLDQQQFKEACDELASAIDHPFHLGFRRRLRLKIAPQPPAPPPPSRQLQYVYHSADSVPSTPAVVAAAPTPPLAQPAGSRLLLSEHVRGSSRSAVLCEETVQNASPHQPPPRSMEPQPGCMSGAAHEEVMEEHAPHTVRHPITEAEARDGWDTLVNRYWLQCTDCQRWRNAPKAVRDEVSGCMRPPCLRSIAGASPYTTHVPCTRAPHLMLMCVGYAGGGFWWDDSVDL
jgi:hypothetical protein